MTRNLFLILLLGLFNIDVTYVFGQGRIFLNEIVSSNITGIPDEYEVDLQNCPVSNCGQWYEDLGESVYDGEYPDWIEIYNADSVAVNLAGYGLTVNPAKPYYWVFASVTLLPNEFLIVFASGKDKVGTYIHTNFKLSRDNETIVLTDINGITRDSVNTGEIPMDFSVGRAMAISHLG